MLPDEKMQSRRTSFSSSCSSLALSVNCCAFFTASMMLPMLPSAPNGFFPPASLPLPPPISICTPPRATGVAVRACRHVPATADRAISAPAGTDGTNAQGAMVGEGRGRGVGRYGEGGGEGGDREMGERQWDDLKGESARELVTVDTEHSGGDGRDRRWGRRWWR